MKNLIVVTLSISFMFCSCQRNIKTSQAVIGDVFTPQNLPTTLFSISNDKDTILTGKCGTKIRVQKHTFVYSNGNHVIEKVVLELKEALTSRDMVLGNMTTVSDGKILESGGMIYLGAKSGEEVLSIDSSTAIEVTVPTGNKKESMKIYSSEFDSSTKQLNWVDPVDLVIKKNTTDTSANVMAVIDRPFVNNADQTLVLNNQEIPSPPLRPQKYGDKADTIISLIFDTLSFPELATYRNVKFKLLDNKNFDDNDSKIIWSSMELKKSEEQGIYILTIAGFKNNRTIQKDFKVAPVFTGSDYTAAMKEYSEKYEQYDKKKKAIEAQRIEDERNQKIALEKAEAQWKAQQVAAEKIAAEWAKRGEMAEATEYAFTLKKLGWANIDRLYNNPRTKPIELKTVVENQNDFELIYISMLFDKDKIYIPGYLRADKTFGFTHSDTEETQLPLGESATILATAYKNGELYFVMRKFIIDEKQTISLTLQPTTLNELKKEIKLKL